MNEKNCIVADLISAGSICSLAAMVLSGCVATINGADFSTPATGTPLHRIYICVIASHSGIIVQQKEALPLLHVASDEFPDANYLEFGWGDRTWYETLPQDRTALMGFRAMTASTGSALFVGSVKQDIEEYCPDNRRYSLDIGRQNFYDLMEFVNRSFALDSKGNPQRLKLVEGDDFQYAIYAANGGYHALNNSNSWTSEALGAARVTFSAGVER